MKKLVIILATTLLSATAYCQTSKDLFKEGEKLLQSEQWQPAYDKFNAAISMDGEFYDAYLDRGKTELRLNRPQDALNDFLKVLSNDSKAKDAYMGAGDALFALGDYQNALQKYASVASPESIHKTALTKIMLKDYEGTIQYCSIQSADDYDDVLRYYKAVAYDSLKDYNDAQKFYNEAIAVSEPMRKKGNLDFESRTYYRNYYLGLAGMQVKKASYSDAITNYTEALKYSLDDAAIYTLRGTAYNLNNDTGNALADFDRSLKIDNNNYMTHYQQGVLYYKMRELNSAIDNLCSAVRLNPAFPDAYVVRAQCYEETNEPDLAIKDYDKALAMQPDNQQWITLKNNLEQKQYEKNRETGLPVLTIKSPQVSETNVIEIPNDQQMFTLKGSINDQSKIKSITINDIAAEYDKDVLKPDFTATIPTNGLLSINMKVSDVYDNTIVKQFKIHKTETDPPTVSILNPAVGTGNQIYVKDTLTKSLHIEGIVTDQSNISSVIVNGSYATLGTEGINPSFSVTLSIDGVDTLNVKATDVHGNESVTAFVLNRDLALQLVTNPMGRTWIIYIQNSDYENLTPLSGPEDDVKSLQSAMANYLIDQERVYKNMTKEQMDKLFQIDLRDQIKKYNVNSLVIWYAGHGTMLNNNGYWIPVDAKEDDEFSYYSLSTLKGYLAQYDLKHLLVVSDACETGPAFYLAMRDIGTEYKCDNWKSTQFKSAQVFASSNYGKSTDVSIFAKTFANTLNSSPDPCMSVQKIAHIVIPSVKQNQTQTPILGNISGLISEEGGTFFFIRK